MVVLLLAAVPGVVVMVVVEGAARGRKQETIVGTIHIELGRNIT
jgi:threonine/homoserine/homoserine lactone efflux protein